jgi:hypothetical protein
MAGREPTPVSTLRIHRSPSVQTESTYCSFSDQLILEEGQEERDERNTNRYVEASSNIMEMSQITPPVSMRHNVHSHPFVQWASLYSTSSELATFGTIRHADIVSYSFCIREIPDIEGYLSANKSSYTRKERLRLIDLYRFAILISREDLHHLKSHWTGIIGTNIRTDKIVRVTLFYHTYLQPTSWQIIREIHCIVWPRDGIDEKALLDRPTITIQTIDSARYEWMKYGIEPLKQLRGSRSVLCALNNYIIIPVFQQFRHQGLRDDHSVIWEVPKTFFQSDTNIKECIELLRDDWLFIGSPQSGHRDAKENMVMVDPTDSGLDICEILPDLPEQFNEAGSLIALKPGDWPDKIPKFCLFVWVKEHFDDGNVLGELLKQPFARGEMFGQGELTKKDKENFRVWLEWLRKLGRPSQTI